MFSANFYPEQGFTVVAQLEQRSTVDVLQVDGETVPEISQRDEWTGYVARSAFAEDLVDTTVLVFTERTLETEANYVFGTDAQMFSDGLGLFRVTASRSDDS